MAEHIKDYKYECQPQIYPACRYLNILVYKSLCNVVFKACLHPTVINAGESLTGQLKLNN